MPAEIKKREKYTGPVKTLDQSAILTHRVKELSVRTRESMMEEVHDDPGGQNRAASSYAADKLMDAGAETAVTGGHAAEQAVAGAYRKYGREKLIRERQAVKIADAEVERNTAETINSAIRAMPAVEPASSADGRSRRFMAINSEKKRIRAVSSSRPAVSADQIQRYRKQKAVSEIVKREERGSVRSLLAIVTGGSPGRRGAAAGSGRLIRRSSDAARALIRTISAGGAAAIIIIVIMIFCGAAFTLTGDQNGDNFAYDFYEIGPGDTAIVKVAQAQIGNVGGDKYWKWYGFRSHVHWCACWVSWCSEQCGYIKAGIMPKFAVVGNGASWFKERHRWASGGYAPKPGDVIFFDWNHDHVLDHVGLVESCDGKTVTTIEGNSGNACRRQTYRRGAACIAGYGIPAYSGGTGSQAKDKGGKTKEAA